MPDAGRVVSGVARGARLQAPGAGTRPLSDRVKQALFGALESEGVLRPDGAFLDLFAGSGAAGIEALSRGSGAAVFVEHDARTCAVIAANLRSVSLPGGTIVRADALRFLDGETDNRGGPFTACVADPPYDQPLLAPVLDRLGDPHRAWLTDDAIVVTKHFWREKPPPTAGDLAAYRERRFGETMLTFYRRAARQASDDRPTDDRPTVGQPTDQQPTDHPQEDA